MFDFFVSYNKDDKAWAQWIAWQIEEAGYTTMIQAWDFLPGQSFAARMHEAEQQCARVMLVLSPSYLASAFANSEWQAFFPDDPSSAAALIVPVKVRACKPLGQLKPLITVDLIDKPHAEAAAELHRTVRLRPAQPRQGEAAARARLKPASEPPFPGRLGAEGTLRRVDYTQMKRRKPSLEGVEDELFSIAFSRDGQWLAAGSNKTALLWNLKEPGAPTSTERHGSYVYSIAFSHDSRRFVTGGEDGYVRVWSVAPLKLVWQKRMHDEAVYSVAFSHDGKSVASGAYDATVLLWNAERGDLPHAGFHALNGIGRVTSVAFSPDDRSLAIGSLKNTIWLLNIIDGSATVIGSHDSSVESVAFSPDGRLLASCGLDKAVRVWDLHNPSQPVKWARSEHEYVVRCVAFSPDGKTLASAGWDKSLKLWDVDTSEMLKSLPLKNTVKHWHSDWIWSVAFSPDGTLLASSGSDGQIIVWQVEARPEASRPAGATARTDPSPPRRGP